MAPDDSIVYREINSPEDHNAMQQDLQAPADWSRTWLMDFNIKRFAILFITRMRCSIHQHSIHGEVLGDSFKTQPPVRGQLTSGSVRFHAVSIVLNNGTAAAGQPPVEF